MIDEIEDALDDALEDIDGISYSINSNREAQGFSFDIEFIYDDFEDEDDDWDEQVEDAISTIIDEYGGSYYWSDNSIIYTIPID